MKAVIRTVLAYLIAPVTTPVIMATLQGWHERGNFSLTGFAEFVLIGCATSYPLAWVLGTIAFMALRQTKSETVVMYTGCAALAGAAYGVVIGTTPMERVYVGVVFALLSAPTGAVFHLIRGAPKSANQALQTNARDLA